jgi:hypothetical protein
LAHHGSTNTMRFAKLMFGRESITGRPFAVEQDFCQLPIKRQNRGALDPSLFESRRPGGHE